MHFSAQYSNPGLCYVLLDVTHLGEFHKLCPSGFGRGDEGEDLDECAIRLDVCEGGECVNTDGSFRCEVRHIIY